MSGPRPVPDAWFAWPAGDPAAVLVVGAAADAIRAKLAARGVQATVAPELDEDRLQAAGVVALVGEPGAPLHPDAMRVAGAGRILVCPRPEPSFGLTPGADCLSYDDEDVCAAACDAAVSHPAAFAPMIPLARLAAAPYRASAIAGRDGDAPRAARA